MSFADVMARVARALDGAGIPYMIIGGQAVLLYGEPRLTRDVDITLGVDIDRLPDVLAAMSGAGLTPLVDPEPFVAETRVLPCEDPSTTIRVDLVFSFSDLEREAIERARVVELGGAELRFAAAEDVVIHKILAGRPRDLDDVRGIVAKNPGLEVARVREVLAELSEVLAMPLVERFDEVLDKER